MDAHAAAFIWATALVFVSCGLFPLVANVMRLNGAVVQVGFFQGMLARWVLGPMIVWPAAYIQGRVIAWASPWF